MSYEIKEKRRRNAMEAPPPEPDHGNESSEVEIDLVELMYRLLDNLKYIILAAVLCGIIAGVYTHFFQNPLYQATAKLYVVNSRDSAINLSDLQIGSFLTSDYQEVFKTWEVHEKVISELNLNYTYKEMQGMLAVSNPSNTRVLNITVTSLDPKEATQIANRYASVAQEYIKKTMSTESPNILSSALEPKQPVSPNKTRNTLLGFLLGAFAAIAVIVVRFLLDDKLKTSDDIRKYVGMETLAVVSKIDTPYPNKEKKARLGKGER